MDHYDKLRKFIEKNPVKGEEKFSATDLSDIIDQANLAAKQAARGILGSGASGEPLEELTKNTMLSSDIRLRAAQELFGLDGRSHICRFILKNLPDNFFEEDEAEAEGFMIKVCRKLLKGSGSEEDNALVVEKALSLKNKDVVEALIVGA